MNALHHAHSGLRYLVLLAWVLAIVFAAAGLSRPPRLVKWARVASSAFTGLLDLQVLVGLILVALWAWSPMLIGHIVMMLFALVAIHAARVLDKRRGGSPGLLLAGIGVSGLLVVGGIFALGRHPLPFLAG